MAIEITEFADVSISVSPVGVQGGNFGIYKPSQRCW